MFFNYVILTTHYIISVNLESYWYETSTQLNKYFSDEKWEEPNPVLEQFKKIYFLNFNNFDYEENLMMLKVIKKANIEVNTFVVEISNFKELSDYIDTESIKSRVENFHLIFVEEFLIPDENIESLLQISNKNIIFDLSRCGINFLSFYNSYPVVLSFLSILFHLQNINFEYVINPSYMLLLHFESPTIKISHPKHSCFSFKCESFTLSCKLAEIIYISF